MGAYQPLFHLRVEHLFFRESCCLNLNFVPTGASGALLQKADLLTRNTANGFGIFYDTARTEALGHYMSDPDDPFSFQYKVFSKDPFFKNYTEASAYRDDAMLYFDTASARAETKDGYCLHASEYVSEENFKSFDAPEFVDVLGKKDRLIKPMFIVNIGVSEDALEGVPKQYVVKFDARKTYWKYYLLGDLAEKESYISDLNNKTAFESGGITVLPGRKTALVFRSTTPIPLRERLDLRFQLRAESASGNGKVMIHRLPLASAHQISTETINGKESVISEIYVNC